MIINGGIFLTALKAAIPTPKQGTTRDAGTLPERLLICPWGTSKALDGSDVTVNETTIADLASNQTANGFDEVCLDFNHNTAPNITEDGKLKKPKEPLPVAAYGSLEVVQGEGIYFIPNHWTTTGEKYFTGKHYKDLSPTVGRNAEGVVVFIHSVALCRQGEIQNLHAFSVNLPTTKQPAKPNTMENENKDADFRAIAATLLGLDESATDEDIVNAAAAKAEKPDPEKKPADPAPATEASDDVKALSAQFETFQKDQLVKDAAREGKVIPLSAEQIAETPLTTLSSIIENLEPGEVPTQQRTNDGDDTTKIKALSADEKEVCKNLNITEEKFRELNPA